MSMKLFQPLLVDGVKDVLEDQCDELIRRPGKVDGAVGLSFELVPLGLRVIFEIVRHDKRFA
jgi:hypothetical protein